MAYGQSASSCDALSFCLLLFFFTRNFLLTPCFSTLLQKIFNHFYIVRYWHHNTIKIICDNLSWLNIQNNLKTYIELDNDIILPEVIQWRENIKYKGYSRVILLLTSRDHREQRKVGFGYVQAFRKRVSSHVPRESVGQKLRKAKI